MENKELDSLYARLDDLSECTVRGEVGISAFLSPRELHYAEAYLRKRGIGFFSFGGYKDAERQRIYILPDYMEAVCGIDGLEEFGFSGEISVISLKGSGFESLSHRAVMGSLLGLGIERSVIGDILMTDSQAALIFCQEKIAEFLLGDWTTVGRDKIKLTPIKIGADFSASREYLPISDTVASPRLDCVVAALCKLSREKARDAVLEGIVELDHECEERPDREVRPPCIVSVRKYGKFKILSLADKTKKGRYRLQAEKYL